MNVSEATISRFLHGFSRTKIRSVAVQRSEELRARYVTEVSLYTQDMLVFIDETGSDRRDAMRKFGYSMRGRRRVAERLEEVIKDRTPCIFAQRQIYLRQIL